MQKSFPKSLYQLTLLPAMYKGLPISGMINLEPLGFGPLGGFMVASIRVNVLIGYLDILFEDVPVRDTCLFCLSFSH